MADPVGALYRMNLVRVTLSVVALLHLVIVHLHVYAATRIPRTPRPTKAPKIPTAEVKERLLKYNIMPDIIPRIGFPKVVLQVVWPNATAELGNSIPAVYTKEAPKISWPTVKAKAQHFTLLMVDPDRDKNLDFEDHEYQYWLVANIPRNNFSAGQQITDYIPPIKPKSLDFHRYVFLLFKHPGKAPLEFDEPRLTSDSAAFRAHFRTAKFMEKYGFKNAYAVNFFHGEWDAWSPPEDESDMIVTEPSNATTSDYDAW